jgi:DNA-binding transcriptional MerR regulator
MDDEGRYTIAELADASAAALDALGIAARNGQVRDRPDVRTIRYYGTLGLIDPPAEMTGRTARYGGRHLLQVLAVKAVQARGDSLSDAQRILVGASDEELRSAIGPGLPAALAAVAAPAQAAAPAGNDARRAAGAQFWRTSPVLPAAAVAVAGASADVPESGTAAPVHSSASSPSSRTGDAGMRPRPFVAVPLEAGATLLIEGAAAGAVDTAALRAAAAPLLAYLTEAGLLPGPPNHQGATP